MLEAFANHIAKSVPKAKALEDLLTARRLRMTKVSYIHDIFSAFYLIFNSDTDIVGSAVIYSSSRRAMLL